jgi:precorrin-6x reductase
MPRYHFNIVDSVSQPDPEGSELVDLAQVRREALRLSGEVLREMDDDFWQHPEWSLTVTDDSGATVLAVKITAEIGS